MQQMKFYLKFPNINSLQQSNPIAWIDEVVMPGFTLLATDRKQLFISFYKKPTPFSA